MPTCLVRFLTIPLESTCLDMAVLLPLIVAQFFAFLLGGGGRVPASNLGSPLLFDGLLRTNIIYTRQPRLKNSLGFQGWSVKAIRWFISGCTSLPTNMLNLFGSPLRRYLDLFPAPSTCRKSKQGFLRPNGFFFFFWFILYSRQYSICSVPTKGY